MDGVGEGRARALVAAVGACGWRCWIGPREIEDGSGASFRAIKVLELRSPPLTQVFRDLGIHSTVPGLRG